MPTTNGTRAMPATVLPTPPAIEWMHGARQPAKHFLPLQARQSSIAARRRASHVAACRRQLDCVGDFSDPLTGVN